MIDLAMISAGEVPMEVDRVSCFNSAVMGFSPLLFNLFPDNGLKDLLEACQEVWDNVRSDLSILDKWVGSEICSEFLQFSEVDVTDFDSCFFNGIMFYSFRCVRRVLTNVLIFKCVPLKNCCSILNGISNQLVFLINFCFAFYFLLLVFKNNANSCKIDDCTLATTLIFDYLF